MWEVKFDVVNHQEMVNIHIVNIAHPYTYTSYVSEFLKAVISRCSLFNLQYHYFIMFFLNLEKDLLQKSSLLVLAVNNSIMCCCFQVWPLLWDQQEGAADLSSPRAAQDLQWGGRYSRTSRRSFFCLFVCVYIPSWPAADWETPFRHTQGRSVSAAGAEVGRWADARWPSAGWGAGQGLPLHVSGRAR